MINQVNYTLFRELGIFESRILFQTVDSEKHYNQVSGKDTWCPDIYTTNENNQVNCLVNMTSDKFNAKELVLVEVENSRMDHLFLYDKTKKCLNIYNIQFEGADNEMITYNIERLDEERKVTSLPNFDYSSGTKYFID